MIRVHRYRLQGALSREGALLRVEDEQGRVGFADLHPWESFGDRPLAVELGALRAGSPSRLGRRALALAARDAEARASGVSLWEGLAIPPSHALLAVVPESAEVGARLADEGFERIKIKLGAALAEELPRLSRLVAGLPDGVKVRLDFNERLDGKSFREFLAATEAFHDRIDFIEDPFPEIGKWDRARSRYRVDLACDRRLDQVREQGPDVEVLVVKPALGDPQALCEGVYPDRCVVTSYLDHPLGQAAAAVAAGELARRHPEWIDTCGLLSHGVYRANAFSERLTSRGPGFRVPEGTGYGFDDLLGALDWSEP